MLFRNILKVAGVCGLLVMFEACYGSPKAAFAPKQNKKNSSTEQATTEKHSLTQKEII